MNAAMVKHHQQCGLAPVMVEVHSCHGTALLLGKEDAASHSDQPLGRSNNGEQHLLFVLHISSMFVF